MILTVWTRHLRFRYVGKATRLTHKGNWRAFLPVPTAANNQREHQEYRQAWDAPGRQQERPSRTGRQGTGADLVEQSTMFDVLLQVDLSHLRVSCARGACDGWCATVSGDGRSCDARACPLRGIMLTTRYSIVYTAVHVAGALRSRSCWRRVQLALSVAEGYHSLKQGYQDTVCGVLMDA